MRAEKGLGVLGVLGAEQLASSQTTAPLHCITLPFGIGVAKASRRLAVELVDRRMVACVVHFCL